MSGDPSSRYYKRTAFVACMIVTGFVYLLSSGYGHITGSSRPSKFVVVNPNGSYSAVHQHEVRPDRPSLGELAVEIRIRSDFAGVSIDSFPTFTPATPGVTLPQEAVDEMVGNEIKATVSLIPNWRRHFRASEISSLTASSRFFVRWKSLGAYVACLLAVGAIVYWLVFLRERAKWRRYIRKAIVARECPYCEYSLEGLTTDVCPECGRSVAEEPPRELASGAG